jgi:hypothetical protein
MPQSLTYCIFEGLLTGVVANRIFRIFALSGGAGGSTKHTTTESVNNVYMEGLKTKGAATSRAHIHGGPIPPGRYVIEPPCQHPHLGLAARLVHPHRRPMGRDGFFIHGRGPHGSDGCIVPVNPIEFQALMTALQTSSGGVLFVQETEDGSRFV